MKATELRIGNYVNLYGTVATIQRADFYEGELKHGIAIDSGKPIQLTEEWLLKFGFMKMNTLDEPDEKFYINGGLTVRLYKGKIKPYFFLPKDRNIDYVHQLQNLYFALTGNELEIKEK